MRQQKVEVISKLKINRSVTNLSTVLYGLVVLAPAFYSHIVMAQDLEKSAFRPYMFAGFSSDVPDTHNYGGFLYTNIHNITKDDEVGDFFTSGLIHTWYRPELIYDAGDYDRDAHGYHSLEGGAGYKPYYRFHNPKLPHKFTMGGVSGGFGSFTNGPGSGSPGINNSENATYKNWDTNNGRYGAAVLSNRFLFPLDGIGFQEGSNNKMFGYGYYPIPLTEPKSITAGQDVSTGNHSWTVFINTQNYSGPIAFHPPFHWSRRALDNPLIANKTFDHSLLRKHPVYQRESGVLPAKKWTDTNGDVYYKISAVFMPVDDDGIGRLASNVMMMDSTMWDNLNNWFNGGAVAPQDFHDTPGAIHLRQSISGTPNFKFDNTVNITESIFMQRVVDENSEYNLAFEWGELVGNAPDEGLVQLPEYYVLRVGANSAEAIPESEVPTESGLQAIEGTEPHEADWDYEIDSVAPRPVITPMHPDFPDIQGNELLSAWTTPGPVVGPYYAELEDGSTTVYYWYKFNEQPYILNSDFDDDARELMQQRVELIHDNWTTNKSDFIPQTDKEMVSVDNGLLVTPPPGLESGYVAVPVHQQLSTEALPVFPSINRIESVVDCSIGTACNPDTDGDGLSDDTEVNISNTDPANPDSDGDGLTDGEEVNTYNTNPNSPDSDGDGLADNTELTESNTDPNNADTDGDGLSDDTEVSISNTDPANPDSDGDGLTDGEEVNTYNTNPNSPDSDADGLADNAELTESNTDPNNADTDGDGASDGDEVVAGTDPLSGEVAPEQPERNAGQLVTGPGCTLHYNARSPADPLLPLVLALSIVGCYRRRRAH